MPAVLAGGADDSEGWQSAQVSLILFVAGYQGREAEAGSALKALTCSLAALLLSSGGGAGVKHMETTLQDDALFLHRSPAQVQDAARTAAALGADRIRLTASWSTLAPAPRSKRMPGKPFDPTDSSTYRGETFGRLDTAVKAIKAAGMQVQIDLAFWAPRWAVRKPSSDPRRHRDRPDPAKFADFASAVAQRYSGGYGDLPRVDMYTTWNEPNHPSFLAPQWKRDRKGRYRAISPHVYRAMHNAAYEAIKRESPDAAVLIGGTASTGGSRPGRGGVPPLRFVREMACVDEALDPLPFKECDGFQALKADGYSHHPYSRTTTPATPASRPDDAPLADTYRLSALLEALYDRGRIARDLPIYHTEYGYESNEPDPFVPFDLDTQAKFLGWSTYLAWRDPDTRMFAQFLLRDVDARESGRTPGTRGYWRDFQTGLLFHDGRPKPAAQAFKLPFYAERRRVGEEEVVVLFGAVRPAAGRETVRVEQLDARSGRWVPAVTVGDDTCQRSERAFLTDGAGFFERTSAFVGGTKYRMVWRAPGGMWERSAEVALELDPPPLPQLPSAP